MQCKEATHWRAAINEELYALEKNRTWELMSLPKDKNLTGSKWVFKVKRLPNGEISRYKARLCAKGFAQKKGVEYNDTFSPMTRFDSIRILLAVAVQKDYKIMQFDIKTAFLNGDLDEDVFMSPPEGTNIDPSLVCKLKKSLYGLKQ